MTPSLTHIALHVKDLQACRDFYQKYCQLEVVHQRQRHGKEILWLAEKGREQQFVMVLLSGGPDHPQDRLDFSHLGFAVESRAAVDVIVEQARLDDCLAWEPVDEPYPVGYYCGVKDPDGHCVEFSYGQPLGPGAQAWTPRMALASDGIRD